MVGTLPRLKAYRIVGDLRGRHDEYDNGFIYMPLEAAQLFFRMPDAVNQIEVFVEDPDDRIATTAFRSTATPIARRADLRIVDWQRANASFFNALQVERNVMFLILSLIILVAAFNIISGLIMLVKDKGRDIAILRTMGATRGGSCGSSS